ncbi:hypothetical protein ACM66B_005761 [Microbotryomycetes sp. NB124-2]
MSLSAQLPRVFRSQSGSEAPRTLDAAVGALQAAQALERDLFQGPIRNDFQGMVTNGQQVVNDFERGLGMVKGMYDNWKAREVSARFTQLSTWELIAICPSCDFGTSLLQIQQHPPASGSLGETWSPQSRSSRHSRHRRSSLPSSSFRLIMFQHKLTSTFTHTVQGVTKQHASTGGYHPEAIQGHLMGPGGANALPPPPSLGRRAVHFYPTVEVHPV